MSPKDAMIGVTQQLYALLDQGAPDPVSATLEWARGQGIIPAVLRDEAGLRAFLEQIKELDDRG